MANTKKFELNESRRTDPFAYFLELVKEYSGEQKEVDLNDTIRSLGLDSLSLAMIDSDLEDRFGIQILPFLADSATLADLKRRIESGEPADQKKIVLRRIRKDELKELSVLRTECMKEYPLFKEIFPDPAKILRQLYYASRYLLHCNFNFTYVNEEKTVLVSMQRPGDRRRTFWGMLYNLPFVIGFLSSTPVSSMKKMRSYFALEAETNRRHLDKEKDIYICNLCIAPEARVSGTFDALFRLIDPSKESYYFVTHTPENAELYQRYGAKILEVAEWNGISHYCLKID